MTTQRFTTRAMSYDNQTARCRSLAPVRYTACAIKKVRPIFGYIANVKVEG